MDALNRTKGNQYTNIAIRYKKQLNDILDQVYADDKRLWLYKKFVIECFDLDLKTRLGDCRHMPDRSSYIRIVCINSMPTASMFITVIHEVSHHIDYVQRGDSSHGQEFYAIHKKLLFAALDMGIVSKDDIHEWYKNAMSYSKNKVYAFLDSYSPHPIPYQTEDTTIRISNAFNQKFELRRHGYYWNALNKSWDKDLYKNAVKEEIVWLKSIGLQNQQILCADKHMMYLREHTIVRVSGVPYEQRDKIREMGYRWNKKRKCWEKRIAEGDLPIEEYKAIKELCGEGQRAPSIELIK